MSPAAKVRMEEELAQDICRNWQTASISDLQWACRRVDGAILLLIARYAAVRAVPANSE